MNINRHNYETFFLLYVDNELSAAERKAVEQFVDDNADLGTELQLLLDTTLPSETISLSDKSGLYRNEMPVEMQEDLLLHLDNELNKDAAIKLEAAINSDNALQHEWKILQQTKLDIADKIVFENKESLYRYERDRVISFRYWRMAAAAAILLFALSTVIYFLNNKNDSTGPIAHEEVKPSIKKEASNNTPANNIVAENSQKNVPDNTTLVNDTEQKNNVSNVVTNNSGNNKNNSTKENIAKEEKNIQPKTPLENINNPNSNETIASSVTDKDRQIVSTNKIPVELAVNNSVSERVKTPENPLIDHNSIPTLAENNYAKTAVLDESAAGNDNKILYMNEQAVSRSKIGGLFRKVKRMIERNTNIKTGNGVRIAGFEIAAK